MKRLEDIISFAIELESFLKESGVEVRENYVSDVIDLFINLDRKNLQSARRISSW